MKIFLGLVVALIILYGVNTYLTGKIIAPIKNSAETERPANLHFTLITNDCENCYDMENLVSFLKQQNINVVLEKTISYNDEEAQRIVTENKIGSLPALVITGETFQSQLTHLWQSLSVEPVNDVVVLNDIPPYYSLEENKVVGVVQVIRLVDNSCSECYDVETHMQILPGFGIHIDEPLLYDVSSTEGQELIQKYSITKVPTIILSPDASVYDSLNQVWTQVGTVEKDGWYIFRSVEQMGVYKDLNQNKTIGAEE